MKRTLLGFLLASMLLATTVVPAFASEPLCLPGPGEVSEDCQPYGSWGYLNSLAERGMSLPLEPLVVKPIDPALSELGISYAIVNTMQNGTIIQRPVFATAADAAAYTNPSSYIKPGTSPHYLSYTSVQDIGGTNYYYTELGWMKRSDLSPVEVRRFGMGLEFSSTPERPFGWVLEFAAGEMSPFPLYTQPSLRAPRVTGTLPAYSVVEVYEIQEAEDLHWYMVGPDLWLNSYQMRLVIPNTQAPEGVDTGRWIDINLEQQSIAVYENNELIFASLIATGLDNLWTRPGLFQIYEKHETTAMSGDFSGGTGGYYYLADVPWTMYYDQARAIHGAYWRQKQFFGYQGSHGCVNLSIGDARWMYEWAVLGDWVYVHDTSGRTPTDEEFAYGAGAP